VTTPAAKTTSSLDSLSSWERWVDTTFRWTPYATLAVSAAIAMFIADGLGDRMVMLGFALAAAVWTWFTFTQRGAPSRLSQPTLQVYMIGFLVMATALILREPVFLVYALTGFLHGSLLRPWAIAFGGLALTGFVVHSHIVVNDTRASAWAIYFGVVALQTVAVFGGLYAGQRITEVAEERRDMVEQLETAIAENEGLHAQLVAQAREAGVLDERQRMAREIHDTIAQGLTGVITQIEAIHQSWHDEPEVRRRLANASGLARESLAEARRSVQALRPAQLDGSRLPDAITDVAHQWSEVNGIPVRVSTTGDRRPLRPEIEVTLLRSAQESLANIAKHASASRAGVTLSFMDDTVALDVRDDGVGFDPTSTPRNASFGLAAMRHRVERVHGVLELESSPGEGTAVSVRIPATNGG
jgi:signal transduction histidine kinase